ncbi:MAG: hypothetical protein WBY75_18235, partial [Terracidiphilus sp.]
FGVRRAASSNKEKSDLLSGSDSIGSGKCKASGAPTPRKAARRSTLVGEWTASMRMSLYRL